MTTIDAHSLKQETALTADHRQRIVRHRRRSGDGAGLPRRNRPAVLCGVPPARQPGTRARLRRYYDGYLDIARKHGAGFIVETPTWRANPDWASTARVLARAARRRQPLGGGARRGGQDGCGGRRHHRGGQRLRRPARRRLRPRRRDDARGGRAVPRRADRHVREHHGRPGHRDHDDQRRGGDRCRASRLGGGHSGGDLVHRRDRRAASDRPDRCTKRSNRWTRPPTPAPPTSWSIVPTRHISPALEQDGPWRQRLVGLRANASAKSHAELDEATELDEGDPTSSAPSTPRCATGCRQYRARRLLRHGRPARGGDLLGMEYELGSCAMCALDAIADWPVPTAAAAVVGPSGVLAQHGDTRAPLRAGVGDQTAGRPRRADRGRGGRGRARHRRRPAGFDGASSARARLGLLDALRRGDVAARQAPGVLELRLRGARRDGAAGIGHRLRPLPGRGGVRTARHGRSSHWTAAQRRPGYGATSTVADLAAFAGDLLRPALVSEQMHAEATAVQFPGLDGVLPGFGVQRPNDWGLGFEIRDAKSPHWTGSANSGRTYGHFGQSGTFIWVDPDAIWRWWC